MSCVNYKAQGCYIMQCNVGPFSYQYAFSKRYGSKRVLSCICPV